TKIKTNGTSAAPRQRKTVGQVARKEPIGERASIAARKTRAPTFANSDGWIEKGPKSIHRRAPLMLRMKVPRSVLAKAHRETGSKSSTEARNT
ncbi:MAG: hypothetical protein RIS38_957, partial [Verrucomicrobiota bacterium]